MKRLFIALAFLIVGCTSIPATASHVSRSPLVVFTEYDALGDSVTGPPYNGYTMYGTTLKNYINKNYLYANLGISGTGVANYTSCQTHTTLSGLDAQIKNIGQAGGTVNLITVQTGIDEMAQRYSDHLNGCNTRTAQQDAAAMKTEMKNQIAAIKAAAPRARIIISNEVNLSNLPCCDESTDPDYASLNAGRAWWVAMVKDFDSLYTANSQSVVDLACDSTFYDDANDGSVMFTSEGNVHPNQAGENEIAAKFEYVYTNPNTAPSTTCTELM